MDVVISDTFNSTLSPSICLRAITHPLVTQPTAHIHPPTPTHSKSTLFGHWSGRGGDVFCNIYCIQDVYKLKSSFIHIITLQLVKRHDSIYIAFSHSDTECTKRFTFQCYPRLTWYNLKLSGQHTVRQSIRRSNNSIVTIWCTVYYRVPKLAWVNGKISVNNFSKRIMPVPLLVFEPVTVWFRVQRPNHNIHRHNIKTQHTCS